MIFKHAAHTEKADIWSRLAEPLPNGVVYWRQDGKVIARDGKYFARFVAYIEANTARERLDAVVPGEWDLTLELLPPIAGLDDGGEAATCSFKARLQILGVIREDVGTGRDYKAAATDAFKRAAVRFGIAHELYGYEQNWVQMDGDGKNAKPIEDPGVVYARRFGPANGASLPVESAESNGANGAKDAGTAASARSGSAKRVRQTAAERGRTRRGSGRGVHGNDRPSVLPEMWRSDVGQPSLEAQPEGAGLQVPRPFVRRRHLAAAPRRDSDRGTWFRSGRPGAGR